MYEKLERSVKRALRGACSVEEFTRLLVDDGWSRIATEEPLPAKYRCCVTCKFYHALGEPFARSDGATVYGYCFRDGDKDYSVHMGKGFAVFVPEGCCKRYIRKVKKKDG